MNFVELNKHPNMFCLCQIQRIDTMADQVKPAPGEQGRLPTHPTCLQDMVARLAELEARQLPFPAPHHPAPARAAHAVVGHADYMDTCITPFGRSVCVVSTGPE